MKKRIMPSGLKGNKILLFSLFSLANNFSTYYPFPMFLVRKNWKGNNEQWTKREKRK